MTTKVTIQAMQRKKARGEPITMVTAYDYPTALLVERAGLDMLLVGDSLGMVVLGYQGTVPVTMDAMIHHCQAVARGAQSPFLIGDMPFGSYEVSPQEAVRNAVRFLKEGGMDAVKLEGGREMAPTVAAIVAAGIPVQGHIGLTPQSLSALGGFRVQGKTAAAALKLLDDALALQEAGCFSIVLEAVPAPVAAAITRRLRIPTIGIGAGAGCDGQVLVFHDLVGLFDRFTPKFVKRYANVAAEIQRALAEYKEDVQARRFPADEHTYAMDEGELDKFLAALAARGEG
ncbi:MAG: 3-methyl-2-oxobutanoate hydroxymethyltransferase [Caldilineales bacterium]|nr:3-methyl-2-oxobutanoate hydroxymethyltransferase [Caldilineales bacterium]MDW8317174.1 3-methyl-2-oxobutanoate hydroxymethyltransferase [Anaerolineae bacterium]